MSTPRTDRTEELFTQLATMPQPLLQDVVATIRIDLDDGDTTKHWYLSIDHGQIAVSRRNARADATIHTDQELFDRVVTGEANALTAGLRGQLFVDGDARLLVAFTRLLPGPPGRATKVPVPGRTTGRSQGTGAASGAHAASRRTRAASSRTRTASGRARNSAPSASRTTRKGSAR